MQIKNRPVFVRSIIPMLLILGFITSLMTEVNLDDDASQWKAFTEVQTPGLPTPSWEITHVTSPSLDGTALRCAITGGVKYSNLHCYRNLDPHTTSNTFMMSLSFYYQPPSTFNNMGGSSIVQALEFTMNKWDNGTRYEWAVQWENVGDGAPKWRYWDPHHLDKNLKPDKWVDLGITGQLEGQKWYTLVLEGDIIGGQSHYRRFSIDKLNDGIAREVHPLDISVGPVTEAGNKLAVAVQLDGDDFNNTGFLAPYEVFLDRVNFTHLDGTSIDHFIGNALRGTFLLQAGESRRQSYAGVDSGPVQITSTRNIPVIAAERVIYKVNGINTSFSEMMALPNSQVGKTYWLPWYNNVDLNTQVRVANVSNSTATVHVYVGGQEMTGSPFTLATGASARKSFAGVNHGPVKIVSDQNIVAAERVIYKVNNVNTSFSEMMALPNGQLDKTYWLPWYNNVDLDTQLRIANVSSSAATVHVYIGGAEMTGSPFTLPAGGSARKSFVGVNSGPVKIVSDQNIVAAERVIYKVNNVNTSFSEMMALPNNLLSTIYWLPWYNNVDLDTQLRIANVSSSPATVHVYIGGAEMTGSPFTLPAGASARKSFAANSGPVKVTSSQNIVAAERVIYKAAGGVNTSFSEMMAIPNSQLNTIYWLPWYNSLDLDTQLRFGVP